MARELQSNSSTLLIFPYVYVLPIRRQWKMAAAPPVDPVHWTEDPETEDFNPGRSQGHKIFADSSFAHPDGKLFTDSFKDATSFQVFLCSQANSLGP
jgi:hypothetical protein